MAKYQITTDQGVFEVEAEGNPSEDQLRQAVMQQLGGGRAEPAPVAAPEPRKFVANPRTGLSTNPADTKAGAVAMSRFGVPMLQPQGGPGGSLAALVGEMGAQAISGEDDPRAKAQAAGMGAMPFGQLAALGRVLGKVAVPAAAAGTNYAINKAADATLGPEEGASNAKQAAVVAAITAASPIAGKIIGRLMGNVAPAEMARVQAARLNNANADASLATMQPKDVRVVPSSVNPSIKNKILESVAGIQNVEAGVARENQPIFNAMGRREAGIPADMPINDASLGKARGDIASNSYAAAQQAGFGQELNNWRDASTKLKAAQSDLDKGFTNARGRAVDDATMAVQDAEMAMNKAANSPDAVQIMREAKQAFAKNYDVEQAVLSGTDNVRPAVLSRMLEQRGESGLTGELQDIAKFHNNFDRSTKNPAKMATAPGAASAGTAMVAGGGNPVTTAAMVGGIPVVREAIRDMLTSRGYQAKNAVRDYTPRTSSDPKTEALLARIGALVAMNRSRQGTQSR